MKRKEPKTVRLASGLDVPLDFVCDVPRIEAFGKSQVSVENFRGVLDYNEEAVKINTTVGILEISGSDIYIESITDELILIKGQFSSIRWC